MTQFKQNNTAERVVYQPKTANGFTIDFTGATADFYMVKGSETFINAPAYADEANDQLVYEFTAQDTLYPGNYIGEFRVVFPDGTVKHYPEKGYLGVRIDQVLNPSETTQSETNIALQVAEVESYKTELRTEVRTELVEAAGPYPTLKERLDNTDGQLAEKVTKGAAEIQPEDLSESTLGLVTGTGTVNLLTIPRNKSVTPTKTTFLDIGDNKFDKTDPGIVDGYYLSQTGVQTANSNLFISGKIPVSSGEIYSIPYINLIGDTTSGVYYNENDQVVTYVTAVTQTNNTHRVLTVPSNEAISYMKLNLRILFKDNSMVVKGSSYPSTYSEYKVSFSEKLGLNNKQKSEVSALAGGNPLDGKIVSFNGDSIMYGQGFPGGFAKIIADRNNMTYENIAVSGGTITPGQYQSDGTTLRHSISGTIGNMRADADYIILEGGVNDASLGVTMGTMTGEFDYTSTLNTATFTGAFENMLKQAIARYPGKKIGFVITHKMLSAFGAYYTNIISALQKWGIPYCDLYKGIPSLNYIADLKTNYTANSDGWHPNEQGYRKYYVDKIEAWMKTL